MASLTDPAILGPAIGVVGTALGYAGKIYLDRLVARREEAKRDKVAAELASDAVTQDHLERAAVRDHEVLRALTDLISGQLRDIRQQLADNQEAVLHMFSEERSRTGELLERTVVALSEVSRKARRKHDEESPSGEYGSGS